MTVPEEAPRGMAVPETPSAKEREGHELTHVPSQPWCSVCVRATGVDARHLRRLAGERAEDQGVDHLPVIQFDYVHVSSGDARGQQVKMHTILDTSTGDGTACAIDVKGAGDKYAISSAVSFLKELGYTRFRCRTDPEPAIKTHVGAVIKCLAMIEPWSKFCQRRRFPRVTRVWVLWKDGTSAGTHPSSATGR